MFKFVCSIYKITNIITNKLYIGQTWLSIEERFRKHKYTSSNCIKLKRAIDKYGENNFKIELLATCSTQEMADCLEEFFIREYSSVKTGYNILMGGKTGSRKGLKHSRKTKSKLSKSAKGRKHSEITKNKLSEIGKGRIFSEEHKTNISKSKKGKVFSKEHKSNLLGNHKGMTWKLVNGKRVWMDNNK